jgi:hypothetical protein
MMCSDMCSWARRTLSQITKADATLSQSKARHSVMLACCLFFTLFLSE